MWNTHQHAKQSPGSQRTTMQQQKTKTHFKYNRNENLTLFIKNVKTAKTVKIAKKH